MQAIGLLGGTFDPIHNGHLRLATAARDLLNLAEVRMLPAADPYQKERAPMASAAHRLAMVEAAVARHPALIADGRELQRRGATYTIDTLRELRHDPSFANLPLVWLIGADAFAQLHRWRDWQALFDLTHFAVFGRGGHTDVWPEALHAVAKHRRQSVQGDWRKRLAGCVIDMPLAPETISSTEVRNRLMAQETVAHLLPKAVCDYITLHHLYPSN